MAIAADDSENLDGMWAAHGQALLSRNVLEFSVKEPLIDLDPRETRCFDGSVALLAIHFATVCLAMGVQPHEVVDLVPAFAETVCLPHIVTVPFSHALTRNEGQLIKRALEKLVVGGRLQIR